MQKSGTSPTVSTNVEVHRLSSQRDFNMDVMRIIATVFVPLAHFFLNSGYYNNNVDSLHMGVSLCLRNIGILALPLFMLLTGYLQGSKELSTDLKYYTKLLKFLVPHFIIIALTLGVDIFYHGKSYSLGSLARSFTEYPGYSWYVEMYIGLFLMMPFLNILWLNLKSKKQELLLLSVLIFLSLAPTIINVYGIGSSNWYAADSKPYFKIIPSFWTILYPITHYYAGAFLKKYRDDIKVKPLKAFMIFLTCYTLSSVYSITRNLGATPSVYNWLGRSSLLNFVVSLSLINFVSSINFGTVPNILRKFAAKLSDLSFGAYLASYIVDCVVYPPFNNRIGAFSDKLPYLPLIVGVVVIASFVISFIVDFISKPLIKASQNLILMAVKKKSKSPSK